MNRLIMFSIGVLMTLTLATDVAAQSSVQSEDDALQRSGTEREQHAQSIYSGVFGQCRDHVDTDTSGVVAIIFSVGKSGDFGATAMHSEQKGERVLRDLARCMGERANQARHFPRTGSKTIVGVKFHVSNDGDLLIMGAGETATLTDGDVFRWARQKPAGGNA